MAGISSAEDTLNHLHRLAQKPGVQSTLILSRANGAIVRASGLLVAKTPPSGTNQPDDDNTEDIDKVDQADRAAPQPNGRRSSNGDQDGRLRRADEVAQIAWKFFRAAGDMVDEMSGENDDEVRLLRLRMRKCEVVIVPDPKYLLVVIHDTPAA